MRWSPSKTSVGDGGRLGVAAITYIAVDYLREISPTWHSRLQPLLWSILSLVAISRVLSYKHWPAEFRSAIPFVLSLVFLLLTLLVEAICVRFVTAVLGVDWHRNTNPLPDTGQWLLLALNEKLPQIAVDMLRAHIIGLHHYLMLFIMLGFSVLFDSVKAPGLGLGARYLFTMSIGRILRTISFVSTILPSARPWCASVRYSVPDYPHSWAQKYYVPYASDPNAIRQVLYQDMAYAGVGTYPSDYRPDWGYMSFLVDFLRPRPSEGTAWYQLLKKAEGGCNDLVYSGHMNVAVLTAMAWTEAYGGYSSGIIWALVLHSAQREVRERHHYSVDCIVAIYVGILLWKMTGFLWPVKSRNELNLERLQGKLFQAAKEGDMEEVREILKEVDLGRHQEERQATGKYSWVFPCVIIFSTLIMVILAFVLTSAG